MCGLEREGEKEEGKKGGRERKRKGGQEGGSEGRRYTSQDALQLQRLSYTASYSCRRRSSDRKPFRCGTASKVEENWTAQVTHLSCLCTILHRVYMCMFVHAPVLSFVITVVPIRYGSKT